MRFGDILRMLLEEKDISQKEMAESLNISPSTLGNYIRNLRQPDYETLCKIASYFSVSTDYLLDYHGGAAASPLEDDLIRVFRNLTPEQQKIYIQQGKAFITE